jgi:TonB family protein
MRTVIPHRVRVVLPAAVCSVFAASAHAQSEERIGNVAVHLVADSAVGRDVSFAILRPDGGATEGALVWACGGDPTGLAAGVYLARDSADTASVTVAWRFDQGQPDTTELRKSGTVDLVKSEATAPLTLRARTAGTLALRVLREPAAEYTYTLAGVDSALNRLGCGASAELGTVRAGNDALLRLIEMVDSTDTRTVSGLAVVTDPWPRNVTAFTRQLERNYPPLMRDAGTPGAVVLRFRILEDGRVDSASIQIASSSAEPFNGPSIRTLRSLAFYPARVNGRPVKVWSVLPISFRAESLRPDSTPQLGMESRLELVDFAARHYPAALKESSLEGRVEVRFRVQPDGRPDPASIEVVSSSHELFAEVATRAVVQLRYVMPPPRADGQPVDDRASETILFLLPGPPPIPGS